MTYPVPLVGEQHYRAAVDGCSEGDDALVWHESDNPYDDRALAVTDGRGRTLGYVPKDSWLREALFDEGKGCEATILSVEGGHSTDFRHVTIEVTLLPAGQKPIGLRSFGS